MAGTYLPHDDVLCAQWIVNLARELAPLADDFDISSASMTSLAADAAVVDYLINTQLTAARRLNLSVTTFKKNIFNGTGTAPLPFPVFPTLAPPPAAVLPGIIQRVSLLVRQIKSHPAYTEEIGHRLGIIGTEEGTDPNTAQPTFSAEALAGGEVRLKWLKGTFSGVIIEGRASGEGTWISLGVDHFSPFVDTRHNATPNRPEVREYRMRYLLKDEPVGEWSAIVTVTTKP